MSLPSKEEVHAFLDETQKINHSETKAELLRRNFGMSWGMCYEHVIVWDEEKRRGLIN